MFDMDSFLLLRFTDISGCKIIQMHPSSKAFSQESARGLCGEFFGKKSCDELCKGSPRLFLYVVENPFNGL